MSSNKPLLICVVGATAIGKTTLSIELARAFSTEIVSADSRQLYKEMSIGTAVPSYEELKMAPHHFIQSRSVFEAYSVGDYERDALALLEQLFLKHKIIILVGGSGLYVDAVTKGLDVFPKVDPKIRVSLNEVFISEGIEPLQKELASVDPEYYNKVDIQNHHRIIRALEIHRGTGKSFSNFLTKETTVRDFDSMYIGLTAERETIYQRINERVDTMIEEGLVEEAKKLYEHRKLNALQTVGYRELFAHFDGDMSLEMAISEIKKNTRRFAKRQETWFKRNNEIHWFDYRTVASEIIAHIKTKTP